MDLIAYWIGWGVLALVVLVLFIVRQKMATHEDDSVHIGDGEAAIVTEQQTLGHKLETLDKWGKILTTVAVITLVALACTQLYRLWQASNTVIR
jgi:hypothetical protein